MTSTSLFFFICSVISFASLISIRCLYYIFATSSLWIFVCWCFSSLEAHSSSVTLLTSFSKSEIFLSNTSLSILYFSISSILDSFEWRSDFKSLIASNKLLLFFFSKSICLFKVPVSYSLASSRFERSSFLAGIYIFLWSKNYYKSYFLSFKSSLSFEIWKLNSSVCVFILL